MSNRFVPIGQDFDRAAKLLWQGRLVALPTETVYGLGADATNPEAVRAVFRAKARPTHHPLIVHLASGDQARDWAKKLTPAAEKLMQTFWPGPLTIIVERQDDVNELVSGGQDSIGLRVPNHPLALALLERFTQLVGHGRCGIAAPSANRFGRISPTRAEHVATELGNALAYIIDGGPCSVGIESTIVDCRNDEISILRPGIITAENIMAVCKISPRPPEKNIPRVSGSLAAHYAPGKPLIIVKSETIIETLAYYQQQGFKLALISHQELKNLREHDLSAITTLGVEPKGYAKGLYQALRQHDESAVDLIIIERPPQSSDWLAINDRIGRAALGSGEMLMRPKDSLNNPSISDKLS